MSASEFQEFIIKSGLKKIFIAKEVLDAPHWVVSKWIKGETMLYPYQQKKLDAFCAEYIKNNLFMQNDN